MGLEEELATFRAEFERTAPSGRAALYSAKIEELRGRFWLEDALAVGDEAPDFTLPDSRGRQVSLAAVLRAGPAVVTFYRGGWCLRTASRGRPLLCGARCPRPPGAGRFCCHAGLGGGPTAGPARGGGAPASLDGGRHQQGAHLVGASLAISRQVFLHPSEYGR